MKRYRHLIARLYYDAPMARKIASITILTAAVTLMLLSSAYVARNWTVFKQEKLNQLETLAGIVGSSSHAALLFDDPEAATEYVGFLAHEPSIENAIVYDAEGLPFAYYSRSEDFQPHDPPERSGGIILGDRISYSKPIALQGRQIGTVFIQLDTASPKRFLAQSLIAALLLLAAGVGLAIALVSRLGRVLTTPITELANLAKDISKDNDYSKEARVHYNDEIGTLAESFNFMLKRIQQRENALKEVQHDLERKVRDRTQALETANQTLLQARDEARSASKAKSNFLSVMSHELRTPMNAIIGMSNLLDDYELSDEKHEAVEIIRKSSDSLLNLVNDILDYSKIESGRLEIENAPFDLYSCLSDPAAVVAAQSENENVAFIIDYAPDLPERLNGDQVRLRQIVTNLLSNAFKFTSRGHVALRVRRAGSDTAPMMEIVVEDTGIGIPRERIPRLFEHFSQVDASTTRKYGGTGLGLAISQRLAAAMGGDIKVDSDYGSGTRFTVTLPVQPVDPTRHIFETLQFGESQRIDFLGFEPQQKDALRRLAEALNATARTRAPDAPGRKVQIIAAVHRTIPDIQAHLEREAPSNRHNVVFACQPSKAIDLQTRLGAKAIGVPIFAHNLVRLLEHVEPATPGGGRESIQNTAREQNQLSILLAEDNLVNQKVFLLMMERAGHSVDVVNHGGEAIAAVENKAYDIVFMDYRMPEVDGLEATRAIRARFKPLDTPYIVGLTANAETETSAALLASGMNACLTKPARRSDLDAAVRQFLEWRDQCLVP